MKRFIASLIAAASLGSVSLPAQAQVSLSQSDRRFDYIFYSALEDNGVYMSRGPLIDPVNRMLGIKFCEGFIDGSSTPASMQEAFISSAHDAESMRASTIFLAAMGAGIYAYCPGFVEQYKAADR